MSRLAKSAAIALSCSVICAQMLTSTARAEDPAPAQEAVENRQSVFKLIGWSFSPAIGPMIPDAFALDTHQTAALKTRACAAIWSNLADFSGKQGLPRLPRHLPGGLILGGKR